ncbi:IS30 family transposase [Nocardioides cheoyonin]|uniref:IS30 family transposase n=1 Tax=Nocardioides cheoyonin TaxID=3156615 RepID=UPI003CCC5456
MTRACSPEVRSRLFELVCSGASLSAAAREIGVARQTAMRWWAQSGPMGMVLQKGRYGGLARVPERGPVEPVRPGKRRMLTSEDRAVIAAGVRAQWTLTRIGAELGRDTSVISRELARHRGPGGSYVGALAHRAAAKSRERPKTAKLAANPAMAAAVTGWLEQGWSPGLIAAVLRADHPGDEAAARMSRVSHETIYQALYVQTRGQLRADLHRCLSLKRRARRPRSRAGAGRTSSRYAEAFTISQRPAEVADRAVPGHWEGDLILGAGNGSAIGTLVERSTRFTILLHLPGRHDADSVAEAMLREMSRLPEHLRRSITWDRGSELAHYRHIQLELGAPVYFCDPHSPWQRGTNENTNRLLRHWFAKGSDLSVHTAADLHRIAATLNQRPRPTLDLQTPAQRLAQLLDQAA